MKDILIGIQTSITIPNDPMIAVLVSRSIRTYTFTDDILNAY